MVLLFKVIKLEIGFNLVGLGDRDGRFLNVYPAKQSKFVAVVLKFMPMGIEIIMCHLLFFLLLYHLHLVMNFFKGLWSPKLTYTFYPFS